MSSGFDDHPDTFVKVFGDITQVIYSRRQCRVVFNSSLKAVCLHVEYYLACSVLQGDPVCFAGIEIDLVPYGGT